MSVYAAAMGLAALGMGLLLAELGYRLSDPWAVAALATAAAAAERSTVRLSANVEISIGLLPTLFAAVVFGPCEAMLVGAASMIADLKAPYLRWIIYTSSRSLTGAITGLVAVALEARISTPALAFAVATVAGALASEGLDLFFNSLTLYLRGKGRLFEGARTLGPVVLGALPFFVPVVALLAFAYREISPWTLPLFLVPAFTAQRLSVLYQAQRSLAQDLVAANEQLERANLSFATALVATLDARDEYTAGHSAAVAIYARDIAARMALSDQDQQLAHLCGLVHDIGKIGLPAGLLEKRGPLTLDERRQMEEHSAIGERILAKVDDYGQIATVVRHHHERVDGRGYPDGLAADEIPLIARIIAVADAYNAMTSNRPYRDAMPSRIARLRLAQAVESQFDTGVVAAFEAILATSDEDYRTGSGLAFQGEPLHANPGLLLPDAVFSSEAAA